MFRQYESYVTLILHLNNKLCNYELRNFSLLNFLRSTHPVTEISL